MKIAGIDPSIDSTGVCVAEVSDEDYSLQSMSFYGHNPVGKRCIDEGNLHVMHLGSDYSGKPLVVRRAMVKKSLSGILEGVKCASIEGYSMGSMQQSRALLQIAEFCGGIRMQLYEMNIAYVDYSPSTIKVYATGNGNATKSMMSAAFRKFYPEWYPEGLNKLKQDDTPMEDIVDSFWFMHALWNSIRYSRCKNRMLQSDIDRVEFSTSVKNKSIVESPLISPRTYDGNHKYRLSTPRMWRELEPTKPMPYIELQIHQQM